MGVGFDQFISPIEEGKSLELPDRLFPEPVMVDTIHISGKAQKFHSGQLLVEVGPVRYKPDVPLGLHWIFANIDSVPPNPSGCGLHDTADDLNRSGLASTVRSDKTENLALLDGQGQVIDSGKGNIFFRDYKF